MNDIKNKLPVSSRRKETKNEPTASAADAGGIGTFEFDLASGQWRASAQAARLFGLEPDSRNAPFIAWEEAIVAADRAALRSALADAGTSGRCDIAFRVRHADGRVNWLSLRGQVEVDPSTSSRVLRGAVLDITESKAREDRLLALNEALEGRLSEKQEEARLLEVLNRTCLSLAVERNLEPLVQLVTDAGVELSHAQFGAFFYNAVQDSGESYTLHTLSGAPREAFSRYPMPRNTAIFEPTFRGTGPVRSDDILADPRYGRNAPYNGMPEGHLPVRSYLAVPVVSRGGEVLGGLFFGHPQPGVFKPRTERIVQALAAQAAIAIDNARLNQTSEQEITARKKAEDELQRLNRLLQRRAEKRGQQLAASRSRLAETERRFRLLVEGVTDYAIYMLDPDGHIVNWNPGAERIKGYSRDEALGRHFSDFYTIEDRRAGVPQRALAEAVKTGKYEAEGWRLRKNQSRFWASVMINAIKDDDGALLGFAKITRDLTERRAADERTRQAQKMEGIGQLTGGVAHDFNNLLTIIIGNLETLQRNLDSSHDIQRIRRSAENAMRGARRAESLTQRLLAFSRQQPLDPKPIDIGRLVTGMSDLLRRTIGEQIAVETVLGGGLWRAHADPNQLELAILNLAVNARDAMPDGGKLTIETANVYLDEAYAASQAEVVPGQYVLVAVSDNGCGMSAEVRAKAFDPFFTTKDIGHGTGLGLSQVYGFVKQSRGHVKIYSEVGEGTTIKLYLPRVYEGAAVVEEQPHRPLLRGSQKETILVVEDDPDVRMYSCETLRELGYAVIEAENAHAGLHRLERNADVRLLFTDIGLPGGMNGRQLADEARRRRPLLKVLFTTGYARNAIVHDGRLDPGVALVTKPFTQAALAAKLRDILDADRRPGRILVVEDEPLIQMLAADYLSEAGFTVDVAGSGTVALNKLALVPGGFDAAIVDFGLPDTRGEDLIRDIRALYPSLPIVVATGESAADLGRVLDQHVAISFVGKPYTADDLIVALESAGVARN